MNENGKNGNMKWFVSMIGGIVAIGIWVGSQQTTISAQSKEIDMLRKDYKEINEKLASISTSVAVIAARMP